MTFEETRSRSPFRRCRRPDRRHPRDCRRAAARGAPSGVSPRRAAHPGRAFLPPRP